MAKQNSTSTLKRADHPTAPLPPLAAAAMASLEARLAGRTLSDQLAHEASTHVRVTPETHRAVVRYGICLETYARLAMMDARTMSGAQFTLMVEAQDEMTQRHEQLEQAGMLHLVVAS